MTPFPYLVFDSDTLTRPTRAAWLAERQTGIGSSDAPNLVGVGYRTAADVYRSKVEPVSDRDPAGRLRRGILLEPLAAAEYAAVMGVELTPAPFARHPDMPWLVASPDYTRADGRRVEIKTTAGFGDGWGESGTADVPPGYRVQVQHQMGVAGAAGIDLAALDVIEWELRVYRLEFDPEFWAWLVAVAAEFWGRVQSRTPPGPEWEARFAPKAEEWLTVPGTSIDLGAEVGRLLDQRKLLADVRDEAGAECDRLTARVRALMGTADKAVAGPWKVNTVRVKEHVVKEHTRAAGSHIRCTLARGK